MGKGNNNFLGGITKRMGEGIYFLRLCFIGWEVFVIEKRYICMRVRGRRDRGGGRYTKCKRLEAKSKKLVADN